MKLIKSIKTKEDFDQEVSENKSILRAIRLKCLDCSAYQEGEIRECPVTTCPLYPFRLGKNPFLKKQLTEEERSKIRERFINNVLK